jgi:cytochrome d ubiquinol oxidase subunit II
MMIDYEVLRVIWWLLMGVLLMGFAVFDGFDLGVSALLLWLGKTDAERRVMLNTVGPVWEGNQVWFILGGGVFFAAWPYLYAAVFSGLYLAILLVLLTFIMRPVGFKYRSKLENTGWRTLWDMTLAIAGTLAALTFGVAVGNVFLGLPFNLDSELRIFYTGSFWELFKPFPLWCGVLALAMFLMQGAAYLITKTEGALQSRARNALMLLALLAFVFFGGGWFWVQHLQGYVLSGVVDHNGFSNPLNKPVTLQVGAWLSNYEQHHEWYAVPAIGMITTLLTLAMARTRLEKLLFVLSSVSLIFIIGTAGLAFFPFILPSSTEPGSSLLVCDASASHRSLWLMLIATVIFMPIVLAYTAWVYRVLRGKVRVTDISPNDSRMY